MVQNGGSQYSVPFIFNGTVWQPLATNRAIPTAWDDDFDGSTMDMNKWIRYDPASIKSYVADSMNCSWLSLDCFNAGVIQRAYGYMQPVPSGNWTFRMKYANDCATGQHYGPGGFVMNAGGKMIIGIGASMIHSQTGTYWFIRQKDGIIASESDACDNPSTPCYMEIEYDGTNIYYRASVTGAYYTTFFTEALSTYLVTAPAFIGFSLHPYGDSSSNPKMGMTGSWDWFRRVA